MSNVSPAAVGKGAFVAAVIGFVFGLIGRTVGAESSLMFLLVIVIFGGMALGGYVAGREVPTYALTNGGLAALVATALLQTVSVGIAAARGTLSSGAVITVVFILLLSTSMGVIGGYVAYRRVSPNDPSGASGGAADAKEAV